MICSLRIDADQGLHMLQEGKENPRDPQPAAIYSEGPAWSLFLPQIQFPLKKELDDEVYSMSPSLAPSSNQR